MLYTVDLGLCDYVPLLQIRSQILQQFNCVFNAPKTSNGTCPILPLAHSIHSVSGTNKLDYRA